MKGTNMAATKEDISKWFDAGVKKDATHLIVVCDTFEHCDYPVFVTIDQDIFKERRDIDEMDMQSVMEVYNLTMDKSGQLAEKRSLNC